MAQKWKKEATTLPEQLENAPRFSRKQNTAFEFFLDRQEKVAGNA